MTGDMEHIQQRSPLEVGGFAIVHIPDSDTYYRKLMQRFSESMSSLGIEVKFAYSDETLRDLLGCYPGSPVYLSCLSRNDADERARYYYEYVEDLINSLGNPQVEVIVKTHVWAEGVPLITTRSSMASREYFVVPNLGDLIIAWNQVQRGRPQNIDGFTTLGNRASIFMPFLTVSDQLEVEKSVSEENSHIGHFVRYSLRSSGRYDGEEIQVVPYWCPINGNQLSSWVHYAEVLSNLGIDKHQTQTRIIVLTWMNPKGIPYFDASDTNVLFTCGKYVNGVTGLLMQALEFRESIPRVSLPQTYSNPLTAMSSRDEALYRLLFKYRFLNTPDHRRCYR